MAPASDERTWDAHNYRRCVQEALWVVRSAAGRAEIKVQNSSSVVHYIAQSREDIASKTSVVKYEKKE